MNSLQNADANPQVEISVLKAALQGVVETLNGATSDPNGPIAMALNIAKKAIMPPLLSPKEALEKLLYDVAAGVDFGMPFNDPDNPFHVSVMMAKRVLGQEFGPTRSVGHQNEVNQLLGVISAIREELDGLDSDPESHISAAMKLATAALNPPVEDPIEALHSLLSDVRNGTDYGMPFDDPQHPFHESVTMAQRVLANNN